MRKRLLALLAARCSRVHRRPRLRPAHARDAAGLAHRPAAGRGRSPTRVVAAIRRPGARPPDRRGAARQPGPENRRGARGPVCRRAQIDTLAVLSAVRLRRLGEPQPRHRARADAAAGGTDPWYSLYEASVGAAWQIDLFGRVRRESEAAQAAVLASEQGRRGVVLSLVTSVASSYIALRALDRELEISRPRRRTTGRR